MINDDVMVDRSKIKIRREWTDKNKNPIKINKISQILLKKNEKKKEKRKKLR